MPRPIEACLTIAGSDPSGGAGIQADLKTFTTLGVYGCAAITCLTAQNSRGVHSYQSVDPQNLQEQIRLVLEDLPIQHIKIGMVGSIAAAEAIADTLQDFAGQILLDPICRASDGSSLATNGSFATIQKTLLATATALTPNLPELELLADCPCSTEKAIESCSSTLLERYKNLQFLIVTGGHPPAAGATGTIKDTLFWNPLTFPDRAATKCEHTLVSSRNTHGTGCTFSAAFTAYLTKGDEPPTAFKQAVQYVDRLLRVSADYDTGRGHGGMVHHLFCENN